MCAVVPWPKLVCNYVTSPHLWQWTLNAEHAFNLGRRLPTTWFLGVYAFDVGYSVLSNGLIIPLEETFCFKGIIHGLNQIPWSCQGVKETTRLLNHLAQLLTERWLVGVILVTALLLSSCRAAEVKGWGLECITFQMVSPGRRAPGFCFMLLISSHSRADSSIFHLSA